MRGVVHRAAVPLAAVTAIALSASCESLIGAPFDVERVSCAHRALPSPPPAGNYGGDTEPFVLAVRAIDFGEDGALGAIGLDQDGLCTNRSQGPSCRTPSWPKYADATDGEDGIDNGVGKLIASQQQIFGLRFWSSAQFSTDIESGKAPPFLLLRISGYNGFNRDDAVRVEWFLAAAAVAPAVTAPPWSSGEHVVDLDARTGDPAGVAAAIDERAYVENGVLVARFPGGSSAPLLLRFGNSAAELGSATIAVQIPEFGRPFERATLAGKVSTRELLRQATQLTLPQTKRLLCTNNGLYPDAKEFICSFADIDAAGRIAPGEPCDSLSVGARLVVAPVRFGAVRPPETPQTCPPAVDPSLQDCSSPGVVTSDPPVDADADGGTFDGGTSDAGANCVPSGTKNNEKGVGGECWTAKECAPAFCTAELGAPPTARFCTMFCAGAPESCGSGMRCVEGAEATVCVPETCIADR
jgi:hypothetical protein